jgi:cyclopropane fatty-acyl-phospholipid synthase-like methyltransferase
MINWTNSQLINCNCNFCGLKNEEFVFERPDGLQVVQCNNCGLVYLNHRPKDTLIPALYNSDYFTSRWSVGGSDYFSNESRQCRISACKRRLCVLEENGISLFGNVLEIGCATGEFCLILHNRGLNVTGIDISETAIAEARSRYKTITFHVGTIDDANSEAKYNAIFAYEVIEHLIDPDSFFKKASDLLENNGFLCVSTPSFECAETVGFDKWIGFSKSFEHLYFFSGTTIGNYAAKYGMHVECSLYGGCKGINKQNYKQRTTIKAIRRAIASMQLLGLARMFRNILRMNKNDYQSKEIRHNLLMILRKQSIASGRA